MTIDTGALVASLEDILDRLGRVAVATSGGVDSTTLAVIAHRRLRERADVFHAVSPAVPPEATALVEAYAAREGWRLRIVDAREFDDADYVSNPVDRCYFCKRDLYGAITPLTHATVVSGTNLDDLGDYRPGLEAARERGVRHPYVEARIDKSSVRAIARQLRLDDLADLPAAPCLSSRVETGIAIDPHVLSAIHQVEQEVRGRVPGAVNVRCRVRADAVVVELDNQVFANLSDDDRTAVITIAADVWRDRSDARMVRVEPYRQGSAFLRRADVWSREDLCGTQVTKHR